MALDLETTLRTTGASFIETRNDFVDQKMIDELHAGGRIVCGWSTDDPIELRRLLDLGVDMVTTAEPGMARALLTQPSEQ